MQQLRERIALFQARADQCRELAAKSDDASRKAEFMRLALEWDTMVAEVQNLERLRKSLK
jgi:hypothetical protein